MKIYPISLTYLKSDYKAKEQVSVPLQKEIGIDILPITYPVGYYLSFKSNTPVSDAHKYFLDFVDEMYQKYKDKPLQNIDTNFLNIYMSDEASASFLLDKKIKDLIISSIKSQKPPTVDNDFIKEGIKVGLNTINSTQTVEDLFVKGCKRRIVYPFARARYSYDDLFAQSFRDQTVFDNLSYLLDSTKIKDCKDPSDIDTFSRKFDEAIKVYLKTNYKIPVFDKNFTQELKQKINNFEPLKDYDEKIQAIKAQEIKNGNISSDQYAHDIYEDIINKQISPFENEKFYEYLTKNNEQLDFLLEKLYGYNVENYQNSFEQLNIDKKHKVLLADPGVAFRIDQLGEFINTEQIDTKELSPIELRRQFSDYLGTETIYRGIQPTYKTAEELTQEIKLTGNFAPAFQSDKKVIDSIKYYLDYTEGTDYTHFGRIINRIKRKETESEHLSVSLEYDIAASVPKSQNKEKSVVIKAEIPKLSLLKQRNEYSNIQTSRWNDTLIVGHKRYDYNTKQERIEAFVPFYIPPKNIEVTIDTETPMYRWIGD